MISDDIRKWCNLCGGIIDSGDKAELRDLTDRIDNEMVELPKSADEKIWTGREVCFWTGATEGDWHDFNSLVYINGKWYVEDHDGQRYPATHPRSTLLPGPSHWASASCGAGIASGSVWTTATTTIAAVGGATGGTPTWSSLTASARGAKQRRASDDDSAD